MPRIRGKNSRRKVAFIGASYLFVHSAVRDMLLNGQLEDTDIVLYDIDPEPLQLELDLIRKMIRQRGSAMTAAKARTRRAAISGADYVVVSVLAGGLDMAQREDRLCRRHGIRHTVGDTIGPMCTARVLRQAPLLVDIARDMKKCCPGAPLLSPTNPMAALCTAVTRYTDTPCIGICHGTHFALSLISEGYGAAVPEIRLNLVGVNHLGFIDRVAIKGKERPLERVIRKVADAAKKEYLDPAGHTDGSKCALQYAERVGFLPNNGDHHFIEFFPWFLAPHAFDKKGRNRYGLDHRLLDVPARRRRKRERRKLLQEWAYRAAVIPDMDRYGGEHIQDIILGLEGRTRAMTLKQLYLNLPNGRSVPNMPAEAVLELTVEPGRSSFRPVKNPPLDPYRWGVLAPLVAVNELAAKAAIERDRKAFLQALHLDPLAHKFDTLPQLAEELWEGNRPYLRPRR